MKIFAVTIILGYFSLGECFTKYGRTCKDIGCSSNEVCRMETKPCGYYDRQNDCGSYPTCVRANSGPRTCATHVCPPTQVCRMDGDTPKCVDDHSGKGFVGYNTQNQNDISQQNPGSNPSGGSIYPSIPRGETTPRPNVNYRPAAGGGYQGSQIGSGYPGQSGQGGNRYPTGGYPQQTGGYPQQGGGYRQQGGGYPQQGGGYPQQQGGGYPQQYPQATGGYQGYSGYGGYQQGGYQGGSQGQGGYQGGQGGYQGGQGGYQQPGYGNRYGQQSSGSSFTDKITDSLKSIGLFCVLLKYFVTRLYAV